MRIDIAVSEPAPALGEQLHRLARLQALQRRRHREATAMTRKRLPIGIQTFRKIREDDCYYVDKTGFALRLIEGGTHYFLSRPRRFGKSLLLDTLAELFEGNEPLFRGCMPMSAGTGAGASR
jgi:hypothetical protein